MLRTLLFSLLFAVTGLARAELVIEITRGADDAIPIAIVPFGGPQPAGSDGTADIVRANLERSGKFKPLPLDKMPVRPTSAGQVLYNEWKGTNASYMLVGSVQTTA
ncbi:MAG: Tol-Pal system beta propeller repeat protein TolB, partial [Moraxellaceae bacterium]|nr:Tol-Pal system beta propeller repeat protein TolB [Moraxellaceae bacterium]